MIAENRIEEKDTKVKVIVNLINKILTMPHFGYMIK